MEKKEKDMVWRNQYGKAILVLLPLPIDEAFRNYKLDSNVGSIPYMRGLVIKDLKEKGYLSKDFTHTSKNRGFPKGKYKHVRKEEKREYLLLSTPEQQPQQETPPTTLQEEIPEWLR